MNGDKKSSLLYVLKILTKYTDKNHKLTYGDIARRLREEYNTDLERKTIARNIEVLMDNGYEIVKNGNNGVYLATRDFEDGELMFLTDAIYSSKSIPTKYAKDLVAKLTKNNSVRYSSSSDRTRLLQNVHYGRGHSMFGLPSEPAQTNRGQ